MPEAGVLGAWVEARRTSYPATVLKLLGPRLEPSIFLQSLNIKLEAQTKLKPWSWSWFWISEPPDFAWDRLGRPSVQKGKALPLLQVVPGF